MSVLSIKLRFKREQCCGHIGFYLALLRDKYSIQEGVDGLSDVALLMFLTFRYSQLLFSVVNELPLYNLLQ